MTIDIHLAILGAGQDFTSHCEQNQLARLWCS